MVLIQNQLKLVHEKMLLNKQNQREIQQKLEDEYWRDDDEHVQKKQQRKVFEK